MTAARSVCRQHQEERHSCDSSTISVHTTTEGIRSVCTQHREDRHSCESIQSNTLRLSAQATLQATLRASTGRLSDSKSKLGQQLVSLVLMPQQHAASTDTERSLESNSWTSLHATARCRPGHSERERKLSRKNRVDLCEQAAAASELSPACPESMFFLKKRPRRRRLLVGKRSSPGTW